MSDEIVPSASGGGFEHNFAQLCEGLTFRPVSPLPSALEAYCVECRPEFVGHLSKAYQFRITSSYASLEWLCRADIAQKGFFRRFFEHPAIRDAIPELGDFFSGDSDLGFRNISAFSAFGNLIANVRGGPCYPLIMPRRVTNDHKAILLAKAFFYAACGQEMSESWVWFSNQPWCDGLDVIERYSYVWINPKQNLVTVYLYTDAS